MAAVILAAQQVKHLAHRLIFDLSDLLQDTIARLWHFVGHEAGVQHHIGEQLQGRRQVAPENGDRIRGELGFGAGVRAGPDIFESLRQFLNGTMRRALVAQGLDEVRDTGLALLLVTRPGRYQVTQRDGFDALHGLGDNLQPVGKSVTRKDLLGCVNRGHTVSFNSHARGPRPSQAARRVASMRYWPARYSPSAPHNAGWRR